jgi:hypothetical protein
MVSLQYELLNVNATDMIGITTSYTGSRYRVSLQSVLSYVFSDSLTLQMILCIWYNLSISWYSLFLHLLQGAGTCCRLCIQ